ncbi:MAG: tetraacyldisaccharide 4'-kinase [Candidatus Omnitrophica bacterium]|nr:tetraacyldisaccharide 4'-kinase [Candidatus Omnitrophota bacterium]
MVNFIYSLMTDKRKGVIFAPLKAALYILSILYAMAIFARRLLYRFKILKSHSVPIKVISVGNLTLGGTGKTPFTIALAGILENELKRSAAVLIRGYGWDEQALLKKNMPDIPVLVGEDRAKSAHKAIRLYGSQFAILDDGFQHWELKRDLDIVLVDARNPFGNGRLFPRGVLREPLSALKRAHVVVLTKVNKASPSHLEALRSRIRAINSHVVFLEAVHRPKYLYDPKARKNRDIFFAKGKKVILVSSIGDPEYFEETAKDLGAVVLEHISFGDHHNYTLRDVETIIRRCGGRSLDFLITTEKDAVKFARMSFSFGAYTMMQLAIEMEITAGKELLVARLNSLYSR